MSRPGVKQTIVSSELVFADSTIPVIGVSAEDSGKGSETLGTRIMGCIHVHYLYNLDYDKEANDAVYDFIKGIARGLVNTQIQRRILLMVKPLHVVDRSAIQYLIGLFRHQTMNLIDSRETKFLDCTADGIKTSIGNVYELDVLLCNTGSDAVDGHFSQLNVRGRNSISLKQHWKPNAIKRLGDTVPGFISLFTITGLRTAFSSTPPAIEAHVDFTIGIVKDRGKQ